MINSAVLLSRKWFLVVKSVEAVCWLKNEKKLQQKKVYFFGKSCNQGYVLNNTKDYLTFYELNQRETFFPESVCVAVSFVQNLCSHKVSKRFEIETKKTHNLIGFWFLRFFAQKHRKKSS